MAEPTVGELLARLEEQQARIERLEASSVAPPAISDRDATDGSDPGVTKMTRRGMLRTAAVGTAGVVGGLLVQPESEALAASPKGPASFASTNTTPAVNATNTGMGNAVAATSGPGTAVHGSQTSAGPNQIAVRGTVDAKLGAGTGVAGSSPSGTGVRGSSTNGTGVAGSSSAGSGVTGTSASTSATAAAIAGTITSTAPGTGSAGVRGVNNGTGAVGVGVYGYQNGSGWGVFGFTPNGVGVVGQSDTGVGIQGTAIAGGYGVFGNTSDGNGYGVFGGADKGVGVFGTTTSGTGVEGLAASGVAVRGASNGGYGVYGSSPNNYAVIGLTTSGNGVYGQVGVAPQAGVVGRQLDSSGNWAVFGFGNIGATGTKSALVPAVDGRGHMTLYCMESPECWFEDFGSGKLSGGSTRVAIDPEFAQTVQTGEYHVFLQAEGECKGLSVPEKMATGFVVRELGGGRSDAPFAYRIVARRKDVAVTRLDRVVLPAAAPHEVG